MKTRMFILTVATALAGLLAFSGSILAAPRLCDDGTRPPCNSDDGGGGNSPPDYGDLLIIYRDTNGVPYLTGDSCWQPIPSDTCDTTVCELVESVPTGVSVIPVDSATCAVMAACATCAQEVDFGRINEARSPVEVFESQLEDVIVNLATADCVTLDPAGRLVASRVADDGTVSTSAIDSPLQNLAIYRQLMLTGALGAPLPEGADTLDTAARGLGAASDKAGEFNVDMLAYLNQIMGLSDPNTVTILGKLCIDVKEEVKGQIELVEKCFLDYGAIPPDDLPYAYNRTANFSALPAPAYIPADNPEAGWFEYLAEVDPPTVPPTFEIVQGPILDAVFGVDPGFTDGNVGGFAQATDDTRAVIEFMHTNPVPGDYATAVPCVDTGLTSYDVSISDVSGLQVPVRMVAGTEGREFTVSVANAGPDPATGTVTVTAEDAAGVSIPTFPRVFAFTDLIPGSNDGSWTEGFSIDYKTTVTWTATVVAEFDVNPGNNSVTEITTVTGGGGGKPTR